MERHHLPASTAEGTLPLGGETRWGRVRVCAAFCRVGGLSDSRGVSGHRALLAATKVGRSLLTSPIFAPSVSLFLSKTVLPTETSPIPQACASALLAMVLGTQEGCRGAARPGQAAPSHPAGSPGFPPQLGRIHGGLTASGSGVQPKPTFPGPHAGDLSWPQTGVLGCRRVLAVPSARGHAPLTPGTNCHGPEGLSSAEPPQPQPREASAEQRWEVQETPCPPAGGPRRPDPQCAPLPRALLRARSAWTRREGGKPSPTLLPLHGAGRAPSISFHPSLEDCCNISF